MGIADTSKRFQRLLLALVLLVGLAFLLPQSPIEVRIPSFSEFPSIRLRPSSNPGVTPAPSSPLDGRHVAILETNDFHDEVHAAVLWVLSSFSDLRISFYRPPWRWDMESVIKDFWTQPLLPPQNFVSDLQNLNSSRPITDLILTTCDWVDGPFFAGLVEAWDARPEEMKFNILCLRHWTGWWDTERFVPLVQRGAITMAGLGDHMIRAIRKGAEEVGARHPEWELEALDEMAIRTFVPAFPPGMLEGDMDVRDERTPVSSAVIQATYLNEEHRALNATMTELLESFIEDPLVWGYNPSSAPTAPLSTQSLTLLQHPFKLILIGVPLGDEWHIPPELSDVVITHQDRVNYTEYYKILHDADVVLPAFGWVNYTVDRASSSIGVAATARTPIISSSEITSAYGYFCPSFAAPRPPHTSEIAYLRQLRSGEAAWERSSDAALRACQGEWLAKNRRMFEEALVRAPSGKEWPEGRVEADDEGWTTS